MDSPPPPLRPLPPDASGVLSWVHLADRRLTRDAMGDPDPDLTVRARIWSEAPIRRATATLGAMTASLLPLEGSNVWQGQLPRPPMSEAERGLLGTQLGPNKNGRQW